MHDDPVRDPLDDLIDQTARSMTEGVPSARVRGAVNARLSGRGRGASRWFPAPAWQGALAAAAIVAGVALFAPEMGRNSVTQGGREAPVLSVPLPMPTPATPSQSRGPATETRALAEGEREGTRDAPRPAAAP